MKKAIITYFVGFLSGIALCVAINTIIPSKSIDETNCASTNTSISAISDSETNRATKTTYKVDWFKDNSKYIWDGWKIK